MKIALTSVFVDDQRAALAFYTEVLGVFTKRRDIPGLQRDAVSRQLRPAFNAS
jgi:catechol 2,3-dioxygenase-like lactoylglutathione lyase family enzyme